MKYQADAKGYLDICCQNLTALPADLPANIKFLNAGGNDFGNENFGTLFTKPNLQRLHLSNCNLSVISQFDAEKSCLKLLKLGSDHKLNSKFTNQFTDPNCLIPVFTIKSLQQLNLKECGLSCIPQFDVTFCNVFELDLSGNCFNNSESLQVIFRIKSLEVLNLSECQINVVPQFDPEQCQLKDVNLSKNDFNRSESLKLLFSIQNLERLTLSRCKLTKLPEFDPSTSQLKEIVVEDAFADLVQLKTIIGSESVQKLLGIVTLEQINQGIGIDEINTERDKNQ